MRRPTFDHRRSRNLPALAAEGGPKCKMQGADMSQSSFSPARARGALFASAAVIALAAAAFAGEATLSSSTPARAAAVSTADLPTAAAPSFASLIERVKPAVVSVKVRLESAAA